MRLSRYHLVTLKEVPAEAEIVSHKLMIRAGMIRKLAAGIYSWLPLGLRVMRKVENIVREMVAIGRAQRGTLLSDELQNDREQPLPPAYFV